MKCKKKDKSAASGDKHSADNVNKKTDTGLRTKSKKKKSKKLRLKEKKKQGLDLKLFNKDNAEMEPKRNVESADTEQAASEGSVDNSSSKVPSLFSRTNYNSPRSKHRQYIPNDAMFDDFGGGMNYVDFHDYPAANKQSNSFNFNSGGRFPRPNFNAGQFRKQFHSPRHGFLSGRGTEQFQQHFHFSPRRFQCNQNTYFNPSFQPLNRTRYSWSPSNASHREPGSHKHFNDSSHSNNKTAKVQPSASESKSDEAAEQVRKDQLTLTLKTSRIIDDILKGGSGKDLEDTTEGETKLDTGANKLVDSGSKMLHSYGSRSGGSSLAGSKTGSPTVGSALLERAEQLCKQIREKRELTKRDDSSHHSNTKHGDLLQPTVQRRLGKMGGLHSRSASAINKERETAKGTSRMLGDMSESLIPTESVRSPTRLNTSAWKQLSPRIRETKRLRSTSESSDKQNKASSSLDKDSIWKLVNSPRTRKDRLQVLKFLKTYAQQQLKLRPKLSLTSLSAPDSPPTFCEVESLGSPDAFLKLEDLPEDIQSQVKELIGTKSDQDLNNFINLVESDTDNTDDQADKNVSLDMDTVVVSDTSDTSSPVRILGQTKAGGGTAPSYHDEPLKLQDLKGFGHPLEQDSRERSLASTDESSRIEKSVNQYMSSDHVKHLTASMLDMSAEHTTDCEAEGFAGRKHTEFPYIEITPDPDYVVTPLTDMSGQAVVADTVSDYPDNFTHSDPHTLPHSLASPDCFVKDGQILITPISVEENVDAVMSSGCSSGVQASSSGELSQVTVVNAQKCVSTLNSSLSITLPQSDIYTSLNSSLAQTVTSTSLNSSLGQTVTSTSLVGTLPLSVTSTSLVGSLAQTVTSTSLSGLHVTSTSLSGTLAKSVASTSVNSTPALMATDSHSSTLAAPPFTDSRCSKPPLSLTDSPSITRAPSLIDRVNSPLAPAFTDIHSNALPPTVTDSLGSTLAQSVRDSGSSTPSQADSNTNLSQMSQIYELSLKEEAVREEKSRVDREISLLEELLEKTRKELTEQQYERKRLLREEEYLRNKRMEVLKGAVESGNASSATSARPTLPQRDERESSGELCNNTLTQHANKDNELAEYRTQTAGYSGVTPRVPSPCDDVRYSGGNRGSCGQEVSGERSRSDRSIETKKGKVKKRKSMKSRALPNNSSSSESIKLSNSSPSRKSKKKNGYSPHTKLVKEYLHAESSTDVEINGLETKSKLNLHKSK